LETNKLSLEDERDIRNLVTRYHDALTVTDVEAWAATWSKDGHHVLPSSTVVGRDAIVDRWANQIIAPYETRIFHLLGQGRLWLGPNGPEGRWMFMDIGRKTFEDDDHLEVNCFLDRYVKEDGQWLFAERRFKLGYRRRIKAGEFLGFPPLEPGA
jgi:hypothetical protein